MITLYKPDARPNLPRDYAKQYRDALKHDASLGPIGWGIGSAVFWVFFGIYLGGAL